MRQTEASRARSETAISHSAQSAFDRPAKGPSRANRSLLALSALLLPLVFAVTALGATTASAISRNEVLARAQGWVDSPVRYSQTKRHHGYRTDCSGYVSMAWATHTSWSTMSFHTVSHRIHTYQLEPGDALLKKGYHVRLFYGWLDEAHTQYVAYESGSGTVAVCRIHSIAEDLAFGYVPTRYDHVSGSPKPRNILQNGSFNSWASSWGYGSLQPVWWQVNGQPGQTLVAQRKATFRSAHSSLQLVNRSADPATFTVLSQSVPIVTGASYRLDGYAKTSFDPSGVELKLVYLDAADAPVAEKSVTGDRSALNGSTFKWMGVLAVAPPTAVRALVSVRLAGGGTTDESGTVVPGGTSVTLDDISLSRPQLTAGIRASAASSRHGKTVFLAGPVTPVGAVGAASAVYIQRPGKRWMRVSTSHVYAAHGAGEWKGKYRFTSHMRTGTYRFMTKISGVPGYLGATTSVVSVRLK
jgi:hypothetical protein